MQVIKAPYPWQKDVWARLQNQWQNNRLPHALLLTGSGGVGKSALAQLFAHTLLCPTGMQQGVYCATCRACQLLKAGHHPDLMYLRPEQSQLIKIEQIRLLIEWVNQTAQHGRYKIALIEPAEALNMAAANALLKTLEEPPANTLLLLITKYPSSLPITIRSRCQIVRCPLPDAATGTLWLSEQLSTWQIKPEQLLKICEYSPLHALALSQNNALSLRREILKELKVLLMGEAEPIQFTQANLDKIPIETLINWLVSWCLDLIRLHFKIAWSEITNQDTIDLLTEINQLIKLQAIYSYLDNLQALQGQLLRHVNHHKALLMDNIVISWTQLKKP